MVYDWKMNLYWRMPIYFQEAALSVYSRYLNKIYYGPVYEEWKQRLIGMSDWSSDEIMKWKNERLQYIVELAANNVSYYRSSFKGRTWKKVLTEKDLHLLPILEKQSVRQNEYSFLVEGKNPKSLWSEKTSGTTGTSLKIYWPKEMAAKWWAITEIMVRQVAGVAQEIPRAMMGGRPIISGSTDQPPYWRFSRQWKLLYLSSYHVSPKTSPLYIEALRKYGSQWMYGYGSTIAALAENALQTETAPYPLRSVIVSGDTLLSGMRQSIESFFKCRCFDHYGQSEGVAMAMGCNHGRMHIIPMVGIIEILRSDGSPCVPGEVGEIVATSLLNDAMPLIRYRIGDYAAWSEEQDCPCGNTSPIISKLEGRVDDYLLTSDGRRIGRLSTALKRSPTIHSAQIVQYRPNHAFLLVRPGTGYQLSHAQSVCNDILERIGKFDIDVIEVSEIPKTLQGKTVLVVRLDEKPAARRTYENILKRKLAY